MKFNKLLLSVGVTGLMVCATSSWADTVVLSTGQALEGTILEQTQESLLLKVEYGTLRVQKDKVLRIETDTPEKVAQREAAAEAKKKLEEKMHAEGKVQYKGKWVTEKEKSESEARIAAALKK